MATIVTKTIKASGGDYTSRAAWEAARQADLTLSDTIEKAEIYAFADTARVTYDGWTTDSTRYIWLFVPTAERHTGKWDATKARNTYTATVSYDSVFYANENNIKVEGDQLQIAVAGFASVGFITTGSGITSGGKIIFDKCIFKAVSGGTAMGGGVYSSNLNTNYIFADCIFHDFDTFRAAYLRDGHASAYFYNCTFQNCSHGVDTTYQDNKTTLKNCLFKGVATAASGTFAAGTDYNATNNASMGYTVTGGGNVHDRVSQTFTFVDELNDDFHLASTDTGATGYGVDLSADAIYPFSVDIDNQTITGAWSIGADKYISAGGGVANALAAGVEAMSTLAIPKSALAESLVGISRPSTAMAESVAVLSIASLARTEILSALSQQKTVVLESPSGLVTVSHAVQVPLEVLQQLQRSGQSPFTVLQGMSVAPSGQLEAVSTVILTHGAALEAGLSVQKPSVAAMELLRALSAARSSPIEFIGVAVFPTYEALEMALTDYDSTTMLLRDRDGVEMTLFAFEAIH